MSILDVKNLQVSYGGIQAVKGIDFHINKGELVTLIGANGAGKTSTLGAIGGLLKPAAGSLRYAGEDLLRLPAHERVARGLASEGHLRQARAMIARARTLAAYLIGISAMYWLVERLAAFVTPRERDLEARPVALLEQDPLVDQPVERLAVDF